MSTTETEKYGAFFWQTEEFDTRERMQAWVDAHDHECQWHEVFINNKYGVEYRQLR